MTKAMKRKVLQNIVIEVAKEKYRMDGGIRTCIFCEEVTNTPTAMLKHKVSCVTKMAAIIIKDGFLKGLK